MSESILVDRPPRPATPVAAKAATYGELLIQRAAHSPDQAAHFEKVDGAWRAITWQSVYERAAKVAGGLAELEIGAGDRIAVLGPTAPAWVDYDLGGALVGASVFGIYPNQSPEQVRYLLEHSGCRCVFADGDHELETLLVATQDDGAAPQLRAIVPWSESLFARFQHRDRRLLAPQRFAETALARTEIETHQARLDADDPAILIYTSGTTGPPKGAMLSHRNLLAFATAFSDAFRYRENDLLLSFLPMAHVSERVFSFVARLNLGVAAAYATSISTVIAEVPEVRPTIFGSVPRLYEKAFAKVQGDVARSPSALRRIFDWALAVGRRRAELSREGASMPLGLALQCRLAHRLVFRKIHAAFGGRVRWMVSGAAPISREVLDFFWAVGLPIFEAYGLTESSGGSHVNLPGAVRLGSVGKPLPGVEQRIAEDGEVLLRGPTVFSGYFDNEAATREAIDADGWLHTGDIGTIDEQGFLSITDRKKHLIITAGGKNVAPATIERAVKGESPLISQIHLHGDRRPFISALIAPSPLETLAWGRDHGVLDAESVARLIAELTEDPQSRSSDLAEAMAKVVAKSDFQALFVEPVLAGNRKLARVERIRRFTILDRDFSQEAGELTPTMKMKRKVIEEKFAALFDRVYDDPSFGLDAEPPAS